MPPRRPRTQVLPSPTHLVWSCLFGLMWGAGTSPTPHRPAVFGTHFASVIIFCMQGSLMCNKCKWAMYILCFINSHSSLWLPATALPCQHPSTRPSVLACLFFIIIIFLNFCLPHFISKSRFYPKAISVEATVPSSDSQGDGRTHTGEGTASVGQFASSIITQIWGRGCLYHLSPVPMCQQTENCGSTS